MTFKCGTSRLSWFAFAIATTFPLQGVAQIISAGADLEKVLPDHQTVIQVLAGQPRMRAAAAGINAARAQGQRLVAGPYEWTLKAAAAQRSDNSGSRQVDSEVGVETALRWPDKITADHALAEQSLQVSEAAAGVAWQDSAAALLADWFDALREARTARILLQQAGVSKRQLALVQRRVAFGEGSRLDLLLVEAEVARAVAAATQATARAERLAAALSRQYPGLPAPASAAAEVTLAPPTALRVTKSSAAEEMLSQSAEALFARYVAERAAAQASRVALEKRADPTFGIRAARERNGQERVLGAYVSVPIGAIGRQADAAAALAESQRADADWALAKAQAEARAWRVATLTNDTREAWHQLDIARDLARKHAELLAKAHALGETSLQDLLLARRNELDANLIADQARLDVLLADAQQALGTRRLWPRPLR